MNFWRIEDVEEINHFFEVPYNPPDFSYLFTKEDFSKEYWKVHDSIRDELSRWGAFSYLGDCDFCMNETGGECSRWISVAFVTDKMWHPGLLVSLDKVLNLQSENNMVYLSHDNPEYSLFHILASKRFVLGTSDDPEVLEQFGFE